MFFCRRYGRRIAMHAAANEMIARERRRLGLRPHTREEYNAMTLGDKVREYGRLIAEAGTPSLFAGGRGDER